MTESKTDKAGPPVEVKPIPPSTEIQERWVVLPVWGWTPEQVKEALETYKKAKTQFDAARIENERKQKELEEKNSDSQRAEAELDAQPPFASIMRIATYEVKSDVDWAPNLTYNLLPGKELPKNAINVKNETIEIPKTEEPKTQEEIDLHKKGAEEEKVVLKALKEKHESEMKKALENLDFTKLDEETKRKIYVEEVYESVDISKVSDTVKKEALEGVKGWTPTDITKPLSVEQVKMVQAYQAKRYIDTLANVSKEMNGNTEAIKKEIAVMEKDMPWITEFVSKNDSSFSLKEHFEKPETQEKIKKSIQEKGIAQSGIDPSSDFAKEMREVMKQNVTEYLEIKPMNPELMDMDNFKALKDVLWASYNDLIFSKDFILWEDHPLKNYRETMMKLMEDEIAQIPRPEPWDAKWAETYQNAVQEAIASNAGVSSSTAGDVMRQVSRGNLSPFVRFLADLFAPLGALFGWEVGDFWRRYLHENGMANGDASGYASENWSVSSSPHAWNYIEGAHWSDIIGNALKYKWVTESKDWALIREMHKSGWLDAGPGTAWCMSFVQHVLRKDMGYTDAQIGTGKTAWAQDGTKMGKHVDKKDIQPGDIALVHWGWDSGYHIGFVASVNQAAWTYELLGGNQGNAVTTRTEKIASARGFRGFEQRAESSQPNPQVSDWKEAVGNTDITKKALEWQKAWDIHGAIHCTDWVVKVYEEVTGKSVYDSKNYYNWVRKIWGWTGIWWVHAPAEQIASIKEGQHLIVDHGNNAWKTHSVIALWTPDSAWRVQVVGYPNYGNPPKIETYTIWTNISAWQKRVLRIQWV